MKLAADWYERIFFAEVLSLSHFFKNGGSSLFASSSSL
jgi:hypothetical protein